jgi:amino acid adenylation domain-containing protein
MRVSICFAWSGLVKQRLHDSLTVQAERRPEATAVVWRDQATSYGELEQASNRLARALVAIGCRRGDRVGLLLPKSTQALVAMFATLKADCIYVPVDTGNPAARIERFLRLCECRCVLAEPATTALLQDLVASQALPESARIGWMDRDATIPNGVKTQFSWDQVGSLSDAPLDSRSDLSDPAHILFTSGSTVTPKGVVITHSNVTHFVNWALAYLGMRATDRISCQPALHFDLSTFDIYGSVAAGAQLHLLPPEISLLPHRLAEFIRKSRLTQWFSVPSALVPLATFGVVERDDFPELERLLWCGEKFPMRALIRWMQCLPHVAFINLYGPTEATIASSYYRVCQCPASERAEIPIGQACDGERLLVLNDQMGRAAAGEIGNLYIGGVGLSPGYWRDPEKSRDVFKQNPHGTHPSDRIYKTGDLARIGDDGMIYLVGRSDSQIKSRGYRIELGEIEVALHATPGVQNAAVVAIDTGTDDRVICCAYVPLPGADLPPAALKQQLAKVLPRYMIPARWMPLKRMPLNGNEKTDRTLLKEQFHTEAAAEGVAARSQLLTQHEAAAGAVAKSA